MNPASNFSVVFSGYIFDRVCETHFNVSFMLENIYFKFCAQIFTCVEKCGIKFIDLKFKSKGERNPAKGGYFASLFWCAIYRFKDISPSLNKNDYTIQWQCTEKSLYSALKYA